MPENIRRRQATQTIATAPEPNAWLVRTEWPAHLAAQQHRHNEQGRARPVPKSSTAAEAAGDLQPWFADPVKGSVMSLADCQAKYPHMDLVGHMGT